MQSSSGLLCPIAMEDPEPEVVERVLRRERGRAERRGAENNGRFCVLLGKELPSSRLKNVRWCSCGSCVSLTSVRENFCCREALEGESVRCEPLKGLRDKLKEAGGCVVQHPSFYNVALNPEMLQILLVNLRVERKKKRPVEDETRCMRYCAYRAFVAWCYGQLGFGKRFELPACVRGAIMSAFPSPSGTYVGFKDAESVELDDACL